MSLRVLINLILGLSVWITGPAKLACEKLTPDGDLGYRPRPSSDHAETCEGKFIRQQAFQHGHLIELIGFTIGELAFPNAERVPLYWSHSSGTVHLRAVSTTSFPYQMDSIQIESPFRWPQILGLLKQTYKDIAMVAFAGSQDEATDVYWAVSSSPDFTGNLKLVFRINQEGIQGVRFGGCSDGEQPLRIADTFDMAGKKIDLNKRSTKSGEMFKADAQPDHGHLCLKLWETFSSGDNPEMYHLVAF
jgi:hypothetical protein